MLLQFRETLANGIQHLLWRFFGIEEFVDREHDSNGLLGVRLFRDELQDERHPIHFGFNRGERFVEVLLSLDERPQNLVRPFLRLVERQGTASRQTMPVDPPSRVFSTFAPTGTAATSR